MKVKLILCRIHPQQNSTRSTEEKVLHLPARRLEGWIAACGRCGQGCSQLRPAGASEAGEEVGRVTVSEAPEVKGNRGTSMQSKPG